MSERFGWGKGSGVSVSQCMFCRHAHTGGPTCDAYPDGVPDEITYNEHDHRKPFAGDNSITFDPIPGMKSPFEGGE